MARFLLIAAALGLGLAAMSSEQAAAGASRCAPWMCGQHDANLNDIALNGVGDNGRSLNGIALNGAAPQGTQGKDLHQSAAVEKAAVKAVILPSGETVDLR